jgi:hypothetical protein
MPDPINMIGGYNKYLGYGYGGTLDYKLFENSKKILVLSDGIKQGFNIGENLNKKFPEKEIISTGINLSSPYISKQNLKIIEMDNTKPFTFNAEPVEDNSFDIILLRKGICVCNGTHTCAGFRAKSDEALNFFKEVIRILDKNNEKSIAVLHGEYGGDLEIQRIWREFLEELEHSEKVNITYLVQRDAELGQVLNSIIIRPN